MIFISHRGNINNPNPEKENNPNYIKDALIKGYDVEIDVWFVKNKFTLGHDKPTFFVPPKFLLNKKIWCHAKNHEAIYQLKKLGAHFFWHAIDDYTLTNRGFIWVYPGKYLIQDSISVLPETIPKYSIKKLKSAGGICSNNIEFFRNLLRTK
jgi:hypothetical protein